MLVILTRFYLFPFLVSSVNEPDNTQRQSGQQGIHENGENERFSEVKAVPIKFQLILKETVKHCQHLHALQTDLMEELEQEDQDAVLGCLERLFPGLMDINGGFPHFQLILFRRRCLW
ncbi:hypothetical protein T10_13087 [Trichinella papuae]|uniref:Uncharacterized protein n=1 Tax=Trichinella papuae TaxID=268474 RepID=A0A0V1N453_9BILA|nr:hypothetical protein T10_13087 [Trichinella papuae]